MALVTNARTGKVVDVPEHYIGHPVLGKDLVVTKASVAPKEAETATPVKKSVKSFFKADVVEEQEQPAPEVDIEINEEHN
jgi:hypothetical protein